MACSKAGHAKEVTELSSIAAPTNLCWGEVLVTMQYAPMNPADIYTITTGGTYGDDQVQAPFPCGHDGVGIITKVCYAAVISC